MSLVHTGLEGQQRVQVEMDLGVPRERGWKEQTPSVVYPPGVSPVYAGLEGSGSWMSTTSHRVPRVCGVGRSAGSSLHLCALCPLCMRGLKGNFGPERTSFDVSPVYAGSKTAP